MSDLFLGQYRGVRAVVLGSTGFIGRWVARGLCEAGAKVALPVRDLSGARAVFHDFGIEGDVYELDLRDVRSLRALYRALRPSVTFNLAGYGVHRNETDETLAYQINADLVGSLCSAITEASCGGWDGLDIVNVGTGMEYGSSAGDLSENSVPEPTTLYAMSKLAGTNELARRCVTHGLKGVTGRLFSVYGPGEAPARLLPTLIDAAGDDRPIALTQGLHSRDFVYVEDAAQGLLRLAVSSPSQGEVVNVATGKLTSVRTFVETAAEIVGIDDERLRFGALPTRAEEMAHLPVNVERLGTLTGWLPPTTIASGVMRSVLFRNARQQAKAA